MKMYVKSNVKTLTLMMQFTHAYFFGIARVVAETTGALKTRTIRSTRNSAVALAHDYGLQLGPKLDGQARLIRISKPLHYLSLNHPHES